MESKTVHVLRQELVPPSEATPGGSIWLSNLDLVISPIHLPTVYFFRPDGSTNFFSIELIREAVSKALVPFFPVAGRLGKNEESGRMEIVCNAKGVLLVEAVADSTLDEFAAGFAPHPRFMGLIPRVDYTEDLDSIPLSVLQVTRFRCGGVSLGVANEHRLVDGMSGLAYLKACTQALKGETIVPPFLDRTRLKARDPPMPKFKHVEYRRPPPLLKDSDSFPAASGSLAVGFFSFTREQMQELKRRATEDVEMSRGHSSYEILAAHIWRCVCEARGLSPDQETKLYIATDGRSRLVPPLPREFLGNTIFTCTPMASAGELTQKPLHFGAGVIHTELKRMDDEYLRSSLDYLEVQPDLSMLVRGAHTYKSPNLGITSWTKLPMYDLNFGWGNPIYMGPATIVFEGLVYILSAGDGSSDFKIALGLQREHMPLFSKLIMQF